MSRRDRIQEIVTRLDATLTAARGQLMSLRALLNEEVEVEGPLRPYVLDEAVQKTLMKALHASVEPLDCYRAVEQFPGPAGGFEHPRSASET